ncbi:hypothetical protein CDAR_97471 [Caerostris darwini]|uniref:Uncharacterized protein n=1 Tax=Caerostris darwini TaxID=1538125 RepID=A0AAV4PNF0_9ARAC|nr:hypothetical protein CDAR_97471 [Caerostris darwini]
MRENPVNSRRETRDAYKLRVTLQKRFLFRGGQSLLMERIYFFDKKKKRRVGWDYRGEIEEEDDHGAKCSSNGFSERECFLGSLVCYFGKGLESP